MTTSIRNTTLRLLFPQLRLYCEASRISQDGPIDRDGLGRPLGGRRGTIGDGAIVKGS